MSVLHQFPVYSLVDESDAAPLQALLKDEGWQVRHLSSAGARDSASFLVSAAESFRFPPPSNWSALADAVASSLMPVQHDGSRIALMWWGAGELAGLSLGTFVSAFDVFVDMARQAYESDVDVVLFLLGSGRSFLPLVRVLEGVGAGER